MHSFIHLPAYHVVVCKECKYAVVGEEIESHLAGKKHGDVLKGERRRITEGWVEYQAISRPSNS